MHAQTAFLIFSLVFLFFNMKKECIASIEKLSAEATGYAEKIKHEIGEVRQEKWTEAEPTPPSLETSVKELS